MIFPKTKFKGKPDAIAIVAIVFCINPLLFIILSILTPAFHIISEGKPMLRVGMIELCRHTI